jgi:hypothetical protein
VVYAEEHSDRVTELVLRGIFTLRQSELDFYYNGPAGQLFPERYEVFLAPLGGRSFAEFRIEPVAGHAFSEPGILEALVAATDRFALQTDMTARRA